MACYVYVFCVFFYSTTAKTVTYHRIVCVLKANQGIVLTTYTSRRTCGLSPQFPFYWPKDNKLSKIYISVHSFHSYNVFIFQFSGRRVCFQRCYYLYTIKVSIDRLKLINCCVQVCLKQFLNVWNINETKMQLTNLSLPQLAVRDGWDFNFTGRFWVNIDSTVAGWNVFWEGAQLGRAKLRGGGGEIPKKFWNFHSWNRCKCIQF